MKKNWLNIILPITGIAIVVLYMFCDESCAYLKGSLIGVPLEYFGIAYMGILCVSNLLKKMDISRFLLSAGLGVEACHRFEGMTGGRGKYHQDRRE